VPSEHLAINLPRTCPSPFSGQVPFSEISISSALPARRCHLSLNQNNSGLPQGLAGCPAAGCSAQNRAHGASRRR
jgi:hypothetical protein